jgi:hypothetical protein
MSFFNTIPQLTSETVKQLTNALGVNPINIDTSCSPKPGSIEIPVNTMVSGSDIKIPVNTMVSGSDIKIPVNSMSSVSDIKPKVELQSEDYTKELIELQNQMRYLNNINKLCNQPALPPLPFKLAEAEPMVQLRMVINVEQPKKVESEPKIITPTEPKVIVKLAANTGATPCNFTDEQPKQGEGTIEFTEEISIELPKGTRFSRATIPNVVFILGPVGSSPLDVNAKVSILPNTQYVPKDSTSGVFEYTRKKSQDFYLEAGTQVNLPKGTVFHIGEEQDKVDNDVRLVTLI